MNGEIYQMALRGFVFGVVCALTSWPTGLSECQMLADNKKELNKKKPKALSSKP